MVGLNRLLENDLAFRVCSWRDMPALLHAYHVHHLPFTGNVCVYITFIHLHTYSSSLSYISSLSLFFCACRGHCYAKFPGVPLEVPHVHIHACTIHVQARGEETGSNICKGGRGTITTRDGHWYEVEVFYHTHRNLYVHTYLRVYMHGNDLLGIAVTSIECTCMAMTS